MDDVRGYIQRLQRAAAQPQPRTDATLAAPSKPPPPRIDFSKWGTITKKPMTSLRKAIAAQLSESWQAAPRVTQFDEADITALNDLRKKYSDAYEKKGAPFDGHLVCVEDRGRRAPPTSHFQYEPG